ncbi:MAG: hypothetical protein WBB45_22330 [Cyclobacteriaceae bacterium]
MNRNKFLRSSSLAAAGFLALPSLAYATDNPPLSREVVKEFVSAGHNNPDRVKEMLENTPNLLYARHDWGGGDFEEAIEGAGHVGNRDIARYLISKGARTNLFVLTMLGKKNLVVPVLQEYPNLIHAKGPHGFTLLHHAKVGGEAAAELYHWLADNGAKDTKLSLTDK